MRYVAACVWVLVVCWGTADTVWADDATKPAEDAVHTFLAAAQAWNGDQLKLVLHPKGILVVPDDGCFVGRDKIIGFVLGKPVPPGLRSTGTETEVHSDLAYVGASIDPDVVGAPVAIRFACVVVREEGKWVIAGAALVADGKTVRAIPEIKAQLDIDGADAALTKLLADTNAGDREALLKCALEGALLVMPGQVRDFREAVGAASEADLAAFRQTPVDDGKDVTGYAPGAACYVRTMRAAAGGGDAERRVAVLLVRDADGWKLALVAEAPAK